MISFIDAVYIVSKITSAGGARTVVKQWRQHPDVLRAQQVLGYEYLDWIMDHMDKPTRDGLQEELRLPSGSRKFRGQILTPYSRTNGWKPLPHGGAVEVWMHYRGKIVGQGTSVCEPQDKFSFAAGMELAVAYASFAFCKWVFRNTYNMTAEEVCREWPQLRWVK